MRPYSQDLRERVVRACDEGRGTRGQIAELFGVSTAWIRRLLQRRRQTGSFAARPHAGGPPAKMTPDRRQQLAVLVTQQPDATLAELRQRLGAAVHISTIARALTRLDLPVKKKSCTPPNRTAPTSGASGPPSAHGRSASLPVGTSSSTRRGSTRP
jgi:transposase